MARDNISDAKRLSGLVLCAGLVVTLSAWWVPHAHAQSKKRKPKVIQLEEIRIEGRVQKPNAFYILNRSKLGYEVMDLRETFVRLIVRSVQEEPF